MLIEVLKADNASLRTDVNNLKRLTGELQKEKENMAKDILDLQCRNMRDNIIIHRLSEAPNCTYCIQPKVLKSFMENNLKMNPEEAEAIHFSRVHRLGKAKSDQQRPKSPTLVSPSFTMFTI